MEPRLAAAREVEAAVSGRPAAASEEVEFSSSRAAAEDAVLRQGRAESKKSLSTFWVRPPVGVMASHPPSGIRQQGDDGDLLQSLVRGERVQALRAQLAARYPDLSADAIDDAIQFACRSFLDEAEGITAPGQVYAWIRTAAQRELNREAER